MCWCQIACVVVQQLEFSLSHSFCEFSQCAWLLSSFCISLRSCYSLIPRDQLKTEDYSKMFQETSFVLYSVYLECFPLATGVVISVGGIGCDGVDGRLRQLR